MSAEPYSAEELEEVRETSAAHEGNYFRVEQEEVARLLATIEVKDEALRQFLDELDDVIRRSECGECPPTVETEAMLRAALGGQQQGRGETSQ